MKMRFEEKLFAHFNHNFEYIFNKQKVNMPILHIHTHASTKYNVRTYIENEQQQLIRHKCVSIRWFQREFVCRGQFLAVYTNELNLLSIRLFLVYTRFFSDSR